jgi:excisionase family DNA binding protein
MAHCVVPDIPFSERRTFTLGETAGLLGLTVSTLYAMRKRGELSMVKVGGRSLVTRAELDRLTSPQPPPLGQRPADQPQARKRTAASPPPEPGAEPPRYRVSAARQRQPKPQRVQPDTEK